MDTIWQEQNHGGGGFQLPESPRRPMEFLSRSWSAAALQVSKTLHSPLSPLIPKSGINTDNTGANSVAAAAENNNRFSGVEAAEESASAAAALLSGNTFSFASSATSQLVLERIMSQSVSSLLLYFKRLEIKQSALILWFKEEMCNQLVNNIRHHFLIMISKNHSD